ncbi:MAG TPA: hypothetical protein ENN45_03175 [Bacteroidetes bacterium]|nr:hypothetical protein [Bacteroidota bacterium]
MPQFENKEIIGRLLKSTIGVIGRRTSEAYANVVIGEVVVDLAGTYDFLKYVKISGKQYTELFDLVQIDDQINSVEIVQIGKAVNSFMKLIAKSMGKDAGYYFIKEIKEDLPTDFELVLHDIGLDFDYLQSEFLTYMKESFRYNIDNYDILKNILTVCFEILNRQAGRDSAFTILSELVQRLNTEHEVLRFVKINDIRSVQGIDIVTIDSQVNKADPDAVGAAVQKITQEINEYFEEKGTFIFIEKLKDALSVDYSHKLKEIGVNIDIIRLSQELIVKNVLKALVDVLSEYSTQSYAVLMVNNAIANFYEKFVFVKGIKIDSLKFSSGIDGIIVPENINSIRASELGRALQKIIESISKALGEDAGKHFVEKFKKNLGKAYVLRIEELGVNLHMIELKQNLVW